MGYASRNGRLLAAVIAAAFACALASGCAGTRSAAVGEAGREADAGRETEAGPGSGGGSLRVSGGNPSAGAILSHRLRAEIDPRTASLAVTDTLTIAHRPGVPRSRSFPVFLREDLALKGMTGLEIPVRPREDRFRPRDYWFLPPYDELDGYERARTIYIEPVDSTKTWPEETRVVLLYGGAVYDSLRPPKAAYARGFETTTGLIDPRGAFLSGGTFWIPSRPDEKFTFRCSLRTPKDWRAVSQGALVASIDHPSAREDVWDCRQPMEEIYFVAGPYLEREETYRGVSIETFTYANTDSETCARYIEGTKRYLDLYGEKIGPYPFAKFALVENFWQTGFGMPSFTLLGDRVIRLPFILDTSYGHEILHNWWGNGVFVDYASGNWCEGLTTYGADYLYKERQSAEEARDYRRTTLQGYLDYVSAQEDQPLRLFREREDFATQAIGYGKSMMVFHQIRRLLGDGPFWDALRDFYRDRLFQRSSWNDLFSAFSRRAGRDLTPWKEQWIDRTGAPAIALQGHAVRGSEGEGYSIAVTIAQTQEKLYDLRVPVRVGWNGSPAESTQVVTLSGPAAECMFHSSRLPEWIAVDPDFDVLRRIDPAEIPPAISRTLGADTAIVVIAAGLPREDEAAYEALAADWDQGARLGIFRESHLGGGALPDLPVWFFGRGLRAERALASLDPSDCRPPSEPAAPWSIAGDEAPAGSDLVIAGGEASRPWTLVDVGSPGRTASIGRKIPHYGKYGYLVFVDGKNVAKGSFQVRSSPLRVDLRGGTR